MATRRETPGMTRRPSSSSSMGVRDPYSSSGSTWDPFSQFRRLSEQMERFLDTMSIGRTGSRMGAMPDAPWSTNMWAPELETFLRDDQFVVRMDLPGLNKDEVNVEVTDNAVVIHGERQNTHEEDRDGFYRSERSYGRFYREVPLPEGAQADTAKANYRDGVLEVTVKAPPRQVARPRRVEIGASPTSEREERVTDRTSGRSAVTHDRPRGE